MKPSIYQQAIFDFVSKGKGSAIVSAVAGSGKTTTIVKAVSLIPKSQKVLMLAFNKTIADELSQRINLPNVDVKTFHACGLAAYKAKFPKCKVDSNKLYHVIDQLTGSINLSFEQRQEMMYVPKLVRLAKSMGIGTSVLENSDQNWIALAEHHDIGVSDGFNIQNVLGFCKSALQLSNENTSLVDFDDMIYLPVQQNLLFKKYDWVFVDEAQDTSQTQRWILKALMSSKSRLIAVGDACQAIYGFRGADSSSILSIASDFDAITLPLSISYRCSRLVVEEAKKTVSHIEASETAPEGSVSTLQNYSCSDFNKSDAILCRNVAPLVKMAYGLISRGIPANMMGRDIGKGLTQIVKNMRSKDTKDLTEKLSKWESKEVARISKEKNSESLVESLSDKLECIRLFLSQNVSGKVFDLIKEIEGFFSEDVNGNLTLATVHRSKGLEFQKVFILDRNRFNPKWAKQSWMVEQEKNLVYVAVTRAKNDLVYISSNKWKA
jgi:DNA helicase-2/ATP-dependent DNA helicase PcrA